MQQIDEIDRKILALLGDDARIPVATLARRLNVARTTIQARLERLERTNVIKGYRVQLGAGAPTQLQATALLSIEPRAGPAVLARLKSLPEVKRVHTASGRFDLIVELSAESTEILDDTLDRIGEARGVRSSESLIHLSTKLDRGV